MTHLENIKLKNWLINRIGLPDRILLSETELWEYDWIEFWLDMRVGRPAFVIDVGEYPGRWFDPERAEEGDLNLLVQMILLVDRSEAEIQLSALLG